MGFGEGEAERGFGWVRLVGTGQRGDGAIDETFDAARIVAVAGFGDQQKTEAKPGGLQGGPVVSDEWITQDCLVTPDSFDQLALLFQALRFGEILNQTKNLPLQKADELSPECRTSYCRTSLFLTERGLRRTVAIRCFNPGSTSRYRDVPRPAPGWQSKVDEIRRFPKASEIERQA